jgi:hypothetical protein
VPETGVFAASVTDDVQFPVTSGPAFAIVGFCFNAIITSSIEVAHGLLDIVHLKVYVVPAVPVNVEVGLEAVPNDPPAPDTTVQARSDIAVLAANVVVAPQTT